MIKKSYIQLVSTLAFILLFTVGCNAQESSEIDPVTTTGPDSSETTRIIKHLNGETTITEDLTKIAVLDYRLADSMVALGTKPYAMTTYLGEAELEYMDGTPLEGVIKLGDDFNLEAILEADPDLIIARQGHSEHYDVLDKIAPTIILEESTDWRTDFRLFADVLGKVPEADAWLKDYGEKVDTVKSEIAPITGTGKTAVVLRVLPKEYRVYGTNQQLGGILYGDLGLQAAENVQAIKKMETISMETLPDYDADYIFVQIGFPVKGGDLDAEKNFDEMLKSSLWKNLDAVKNDHVFIVPYWTLRDFPIINEKTLDIVAEHILSN